MIQVTKNFYNSEVKAYKNEGDKSGLLFFQSNFKIDETLFYKWFQIQQFVHEFYETESKESIVDEYDGCLEYEELTDFLKTKGVYLSPYDQYNYRKLVDIAYPIHELKYPQYAA